MGVGMKVNTKLLKKLMVVNEWQVRDIADKTGLCRATISRALHGGDLYPASISKLKKALDVEIDELVDWGNNG